jgi:hypothetical protein
MLNLVFAAECFTNDFPLFAVVDQVKKIGAFTLILCLINEQRLRSFLTKTKIHMNCDMTL